MAITRRQFLARSGLLAGGLLGPGWLASPLVQRALAETIGDRYFVVLFLDGGNDGLNTVVPIDDGGGGLRTAYEQARGSGPGGLRLSPDELAPLAIGADPATGASLGLHPGLAGLKDLYDRGKVAVIQGCGYPDYTLSHEESRAIWESGSPRLRVATGWVGRWLAANYASTDIPAVSITGRVAPELAQRATSVLAIRRVRDFRFPYDGDFGSDSPRKRDAFLALYAAAATEPQPALAEIGAAGTATLASTETYPTLHDLYASARPAFDQAYGALGTSTARDLREVAKIVHGVASGVPGVTARTFQVTNGGYDTHSDQGAGDPAGQHTALHREVGDALRLFYDDCADMGVADKLCVLVWSEFNRRVPQNDNGTDHGSQGPMLVIGGAVRGGVYGAHPNIAPGALDQNGNTVYSQAAGDPFRSTDFRDVYGTVLERWLGMPRAAILNGVLPLDPGDPARYWTVEDFDLGFLP